MSTKRNTVHIKDVGAISNDSWNQQRVLWLCSQSKYWNWQWHCFLVERLSSLLLWYRCIEKQKHELVTGVQSSDGQTFCFEWSCPPARDHPLNISKTFVQLVRQYLVGYAASLSSYKPFFKKFTMYAFYVRRNTSTAVPATSIPVSYGVW